MISITDVISDFNLREAWHKVNGNKGVGGIDNVSLTDFVADLSNNLDTLRNEVVYNTYKPYPLLRITIDKTSGDGKRPLSIPTIRDRVLQTAVSLVLTPVFEVEFEDVSFAYRKGRSVKQAISLIERLRDKGYRWVVDADISRYFDEVDHELLLDEVKKLVSDADILRLIKVWLKAKIVDGSKRYRLTKGVPQGSPLSPLLANLFLDQLDDILLDKNIRLVRYSDDFVVLCKSQKKAEEALELTAEVIDNLNLALNQRKTRVVNFNQGFRFLGVQFIRSLAFKTKYPDKPSHFNQNSREQFDGDMAPTDTYQKKSGQAEIITRSNFDESVIPKNDNQAIVSNNEMAEAFIEAGVDATQFPSESEPEDEFVPPEVSAGSDPRLKTLYLMEHGSVLGRQQERFVVRREGKVLSEIPAIHVDQVMVFGNSQLTTQVMHYCLEERIPIYLLSGKGKYYGVVDSFDTDPVLLHKEQFLRASDPAFCRKLAREIVKGKLANSRLLLQRLSRNRDVPEFTHAIGELANCIGRLERAKTLDEIRGHEGNAARIYFQSIAGSIDPGWQFARRNKRPPTDPINAMFSYGYTLLFYNIFTLLRVRGLNPHIGFLHPMRMGHPALVSDMMEEFRSVVVDAIVLNLVFNNRLKPTDFLPVEAEGGACLLKPEARNTFIRYFERKLNSSVTHPVSGLKLDYRRCMEHQINHLAAVVRQRSDIYQAAVMK